jgi:hypothetical protein
MYSTIELIQKVGVLVVFNKPLGSRDEERLRLSSLSQREGKAKLCSLSSFFLLVSEKQK